MKILYITHYSDLYGANKSLLNMIIDLKERYNIEAYIIYPFENEMFSAKLNENNIKSFKCKFYSWRLPKNKMIKNVIKIILNKVIYKRRLKKIIKKINPDIIHCNSSLTDLAVDCAYELNIPVIWHLREYGDIDYNLKYYCMKKTIEKKYNKANCLIAISEDIKKYYSRISNGMFIKVVYNGIKEININKKKHTIINFCCVGLLTQTKNQLEILKAANLLKNKNINGFHVNFIGDGDMNYIEELKKYCANNNLNDYVSFMGYRTDINSILEYMDVGIMPSISEAFGRVTVEYMMANMPVIGTNSGGTKEIIINNKTGYLYNLNNIEQLSNYMTEYINNPELIKKHGKMARERAINNFSLESNTKNVYKMYLEIKKK